jgi:hypothetical protein
MTARTIETIGGVNIDKFDGESIIFFASGMNIDADGAPTAYHQNDDLALDDLANAGSEGNWWAIATNEGGEPFIQDDDSPAPGYYRKAAVKPRTLRSGISGEQVDDGSRATQYRVFGD